MSIAATPHLDPATRSWLGLARLSDGLAIAALAVIVASIQLISGAYRADFAADADEPGHVVSSLLVRDYIAAGLPANPVRFAEIYYVHYPKIAIGHWPPLLYASEAVWMLAFGRTRAAMLAFSAVATFALLASVYFWVRRDCGAMAGFLAAAALIAPGFMQVNLDSVGPNIFLALLAFWSAAAYGRYLEKGRWRDVLRFAIFALAAVGVHGRGVALLLLPVVAPLLLLGASERRRTWIWKAAALLAAIAVLGFAPRLFHQTFRPSLYAAAINTSRFSRDIFSSMSWPVALLAAVGCVSAVCFLARRWTAMIALLLGCWIFHSVVNLGFEDRFLATSAPAIAGLFGAGIHFVAQRFANRAVTAGIILAACASIAYTAFPLWQKPDPGYHRMPASLTAPGGRGVFLIAGDATQEGAFIAEVDLRDRQRNYLALRASKALADGDWLQRRYQPGFSNPQEVSAELDRLHVAMVFIAGPPDRLHAVQLLEAVTASPLVWMQVPSDQPDVRTLRRIGPIPAGPVHFHIAVNNRERFIDLDW